MNTRVIIFRIDAEGNRSVYDIWELAGDLRWGHIKRRMSRFNPHNPQLGPWTARLLKAMELEMIPYQIEKVFPQ